MLRILDGFLAVKGYLQNWRIQRAGNSHKILTWYDVIQSNFAVKVETKV